MGAASIRLRHLPTHVGVVMDGNRRWARAVGHANASVGHKVGAEHMEELLAWCVASKIRHLTVYVLSADNIRKRSAREVGFLFGLLADTPSRTSCDGPRSGRCTWPETSRCCRRPLERRSRQR